MLTDTVEPLNKVHLELSLYRGVPYLETEKVFRRSTLQHSTLTPLIKAKSPSYHTNYTPWAGGNVSWLSWPTACYCLMTATRIHQKPFGSFGFCCLSVLVLHTSAWHSQKGNRSSINGWTEPMVDFAKHKCRPCTKTGCILRCGNEVLQYHEVWDSLNKSVLW